MRIGNGGIVERVVDRVTIPRFILEGEGMTAKELKKICGEVGIKIGSAFTKEEIIKELENGGHIIG